MTQTVNVLKQDSNQTGLRYAVEVSPGVVDSNAVWLPLEPNSYKSFGGKVKTKARMPINSARQLLKAVVVDLDAMGDFQQDLTASNFQDLAQCFLYAALRTKSEFTISTVGGSNQYEPVIGGDQYWAGDLVFAKGFTVDTRNNGLKSATGFQSTQAVTVSNTLHAESGDAGTISRVGFQFGSGELSMVVSGALPTLTVSNTAAQGTFTETSTNNFVDGDLVTIGDYVYTMQGTLTAGHGHVHIGANFAASTTNLKNAINFTGGGVPGTDYDNTTNAFATFTETSSNNFVNGDTIQVGNRIYTFQSALTDVDGNVLIGANFAASAQNLVDIINGNTAHNGINYFFGGGYGIGTSDPLVTASTVSTTITLTARAAGEPGLAVPVTYTPAGTAAGAFGAGFLAGCSYANPWVTAITGSGTLVVTAIVAGLVGNAVPTTYTAAGTAAGAWGAGTLASGSGGRALNSFGLIEGEFIYIGSDESNTSFANVTSNGFARVRSVSATQMQLDKTQFVPIADSGSGKTVRIYFGRVCKNEFDPTLQIKRSIQFERTLGAPDFTQPTEIQAEYLVRTLANDVTFDMKTADIIRLDMAFLSNKNTLNQGTTGLKPGSRPVVTETDAFNSTSDVAYNKMAIVTTGNSCPAPLFAFLTDLKINVKNNLKQNKAVSVLGAFDSTPGFFQVAVDVTAYFTDVGEIQAVISNQSVTLESHLVKFQQGISFDLPLIVLSEALADVKINEPIMIPLKADSAIATSIDTGLTHSLLMVFWDYLPLVAG